MKLGIACHPVTKQYGCNVLDRENVRIIIPVIRRYYENCFLANWFNVSY